MGPGHEEGSQEHRAVSTLLTLHFLLFLLQVHLLPGHWVNAQSALRFSGPDRARTIGAGIQYHPWSIYLGLASGRTTVSKKMRFLSSRNLQTNKEENAK